MSGKDGVADSSFTIGGQSASATSPRKHWKQARGLQKYLMHLDTVQRKHETIAMDSKCREQTEKRNPGTGNRRTYQLGKRPLTLEFNLWCSIMRLPLPLINHARDFLHFYFTRRRLALVTYHMDSTQDGIWTQVERKRLEYDRHARLGRLAANLNVCLVMEFH